MILNLNEKFSQFMEKEWMDDSVHRYIGNFKVSYFAFATDPVFREHAASGGVITALLAFLLEKGEIDGALVCRSQIINGNLVPEFFIAKDKEELLSAQGSIYSADEYNRDAIPLIKDFKRKLALVALPCDAQKLHILRQNDKGLEEKIKLIVSLFCGHNSTSQLTTMILGKLDKRNEGIASFRYRKGHWRGQLEAEFISGEKITKSFSYFSDYQNLFFFSQQKCHYCHDHTGYNGDISIGDIWSMQMKKNPVKHNAVITRTKLGNEIYQAAAGAGWLTSKIVPISEICEGQSRSMPFHYNVSARSKAGKLVGIQIKDDVYERVRWNDFIVAFMALTNEKISRTATGKKFISLLPRFVLKIMLYFMKGLESF